MMDSEFQILSAKAQGGDQEAWNRLVDVFEPIVRLELAVRGRASQLQAFFDSDDNVQSVFRMCFEQGWLTQFVGRSFRQAVAYVKEATRNRLNARCRHYRTEGRNVARKVGIDAALSAVDASQARPDQIIVSGEEERRILEVVREACRDKDQFVVVKRILDGEGITDVAREQGIRPKTLGMAYSRVLKRVRSRLWGS